MLLIEHLCIKRIISYKARIPLQQVWWLISKIVVYSYVGYEEITILGLFFSWKGKWYEKMACKADKGRRETVKKTEIQG